MSARICNLLARRVSHGNLLHYAAAIPSFTTNISSTHPSPFMIQFHSQSTSTKKNKTVRLFAEDKVRKPRKKKSSTISKSKSLKQKKQLDQIKRVVDGDFAIDIGDDDIDSDNDNDNDNDVDGQEKKRKIYKVYNKNLKLRRKEEKLLLRFPEPNKPKMPLSTFLLFVKEWAERNNDKMSTMKHGEIWKFASQEYKLLDEKEMGVLKLQQKQLSNEYKEYKKKYKENEIEILQNWIKIATSLKQSRPPRSGYNLYISENKERFEKGNKFGANSSIIKTLAQEWKELDNETKEQYKEKVKTLYSKWTEIKKDTYKKQRQKQQIEK